MSKPTEFNHELSNMTWVKFDLKRKVLPIVVIPSGAIEVYGPHLPLGSDSIVADEVARLVAKEINGIKAPLVPVGYSAELMSFPGTLTVKPNTFYYYFKEICCGFIHWGLTKFVFLNTHLGNVAIIHQIADELREENKASCLQIDWWRYSARIGNEFLTSGEWAGGHAGELGTSVLLYINEKLVDMNSNLDFIPPGDPWPSGLIRYTPYRSITPSGVMGTPSAGSIEKGRNIVLRSVQAIAADCSEFFK